MFSRAEDLAILLLKPARLGIISAMLVMTVIAWTHQLNLDLVTCDTGCHAAKDWKYSGAVLVLGTVMLLALLWTAAYDMTKAFCALSIVAAVAGGLLFFININTGSVCINCMIIDSLAIILPLTCIRKYGLGAIALPLAILVSLNHWGSDPYRGRKPRLKGTFMARSYEQLRTDVKYYVLFSDPQCPQCKVTVATLVGRLKPHTELLHRWIILPQFSDGSTKAAVAMEALLRARSSAANEYIRQVYAEKDPLTESVLRGIATRVGVYAQVDEALRALSSEVLNDIAADGEFAKLIKIRTVPTFAMLSGYDGTPLPRSIEVLPLSFLDLATETVPVHGNHGG